MDRQKLINLVKDNKISELEHEVTLKKNWKLLNEVDSDTGRTLLHELLIYQRKSGLKEEDERIVKLIHEIILQGADLNIRDYTDLSALDYVIYYSYKIKGLENLKHFLIYQTTTEYTLRRAIIFCVKMIEEAKKNTDVLSYEQLQRILNHLEWFYGDVKNNRNSHYPPPIPAPFLPTEEQKKKMKSAKKIFAFWKKSRSRKNEKKKSLRARRFWAI